jgi:hypothetical protein
MDALSCIDRCFIADSLTQQIPLQNTLSVSDCVIASDKPQLAVSLNVNDEIDTRMGADFLAQLPKDTARRDLNTQTSRP